MTSFFMHKISEVMRKKRFEEIDTTIAGASPIYGRLYSVHRAVAHEGHLPYYPKRVPCKLNENQLS